MTCWVLRRCSDSVTRRPRRQHPVDRLSARRKTGTAPSSLGAVRRSILPPRLPHLAWRWAVWAMAWAEET